MLVLAKGLVGAFQAGACLVRDAPIHLAPIPMAVASVATRTSLQGDTGFVTYCAYFRVILGKGKQNPMAQLHGNIPLVKMQSAR
jgi:hypothetical protein